MQGKNKQTNKTPKTPHNKTWNKLKSEGKKL